MSRRRATCAAGIAHQGDVHRLVGLDGDFEVFRQCFWRLGVNGNSSDVTDLFRSDRPADLEFEAVGRSGRP